MIFDELFRAEWQAKKKRKKINDKYGPLLEVAKRNSAEHNALLTDRMVDLEWINHKPDDIRTRRIVNRARELGIDVPREPDSPADDYAVDTDYWDFKETFACFYLSPKGESDLNRKIRKEEVERSQHRWRQVPLIIGLFGALTGLIALIISLIQSLK